MSHGKFLVLSVLAIALFFGSSPAPAAQVASTLELRLCARTGTLTILRTIAPRTAITAQTGLLADCLSEPVRGSTAILAFTGMWTTALTLIMATTDRCQCAGRSASTTSRATRHATGKAT